MKYDNIFKQTLKKRFLSVKDSKLLLDDYNNFTLKINGKIYKKDFTDKFNSLSCNSKEFNNAFGHLNFKQAFIKNYFGNKTPRCCFCGQLLEINKNKYGEEYIIADIEHIFPKSQFPQFTLHPKNWAPCCKECNQIIKKENFFKDNPLENFKQAINELGLDFNNIHPLELWKNLNFSFDENQKIIINPTLDEKAKDLINFYGIETRINILIERCYSILFNIIRYSDIRSPESLEMLLENIAASNWHEINDGYSLNNSPQIWQEFIENILYDECKLMALWDEVKASNSYIL